MADRDDLITTLEMILECVPETYYEEVWEARHVLERAKAQSEKGRKRMNRVHWPMVSRVDVYFPEPDRDWTFVQIYRGQRLVRTYRCISRSSVIRLAKHFNRKAENGDGRIKATSVGWDYRAARRM